jgi:FAD/FMN-containing dehydrogenase
MTAFLATRAAELVSYGGLRTRCQLVRPVDADELRHILVQASQMRRRMTFRGQGHAFDSQSLNSDLVIGLDRLQYVAFSADASSAAVGPGVPWARSCTPLANARGCRPSWSARATPASEGRPPAIVCRASHRYSVRTART